VRDDAEYALEGLLGEGRQCHADHLCASSARRPRFCTLRMPKRHPCGSRCMIVFVETSGEAIVSACANCGAR
jgi:hypothetical protein